MALPPGKSVSPLDYATAPKGDGVAGWIRRNPFLFAGAIYLLANGVLLLIAKAASSEWDQVFVYSARVLMHGGDLYGPGINQFQLNHPYTYPPFHAVLGIPFSFLPQIVSRFGWFIVQAISLAALWILSWKISGGKPLNGGGWTASEAAICMLGLIVGMRYIQGAFGHQQSDILIDAFLVAGAFAWQSGRDWAAGTAWGIAAAFKGPPLIMALYLAWRGRWIAAAWMVALAIGLNLVPDVIHAAPHGIWLEEWYTRIVKPTSSQIGAWYVDVTINQSIAGAAHRFFTTGWTFAHHHFDVIYNKKLVSDRAGKMIVYAIDAGLLFGAATGMRRPLRRPANGNIAGLECAMMFVLMLLLSPMSHKTHFGILILPGFFVARAAIDDRDRPAALCLLIALIVIGLLDHFFLYSPLGDLFAWYGNVTCGTIALGVGCWHLLRRDAAKA